MYWHHPALYLLILIGVCFYVIPALIVRKKALVEVGICDRHLRRRRWGIGIGWLGFLASFTLFAALMEDTPLLGLLFLLTSVAAPITGILMAQVVAAKKIDDQQAWLKTGRPFLESIGGPS